jgi:NAD-dependent dihydropyrimidine dehydrogenase PreA subunit
VAYDDALADDVGTEAVPAGTRLVRLAGVGFWRVGHPPDTRVRELQAPAHIRLQEDLVTYVIAQPCVDLKDRACVDECPVDCIYEGKRMLYIHPDECVDCGACEPVCPVEAIFYEDDTPEEWKGYYDANVHFFDDLGSPGGAAKMGVIDKDHELVAALPPQEHDE